MPVHETLAIARSLRERYGITRIADTTRLDRIGIPTISVVVPNSVDKIGVYNGKGLTREHAIASGLMEALERQICARCEVPRFDAPVAQIDALLDLRALGWLGELEGSVECVAGTNLLTGEPVAVPIGVAQCPRLTPRRFERTSTNGLASGNNPTEAIYHALFELVERHLLSTVHVRSHILPRALRSLAGLPTEAHDDVVASEVIDAAEHPILGDLIARIKAAGLEFRLLAYAPPGWPTAMLACITERAGRELFYHIGMGCSLSPGHAAIRAVTEAAQSRAADIQGAREDLERADGAAPNDVKHGRRPAGFPTDGRWYFDGPAKRIGLADLPDTSCADLGDEVELVLETLRAYGETCVAYVDLTPPGVPISVARVVAPHLERTLVDGSISSRLRRVMRPLGAFRLASCS